MKLEADALELIAKLRATLGQRVAGCDHACRPKCPVCARKLRMRDRAAKKAWLRKKYGSAPEGEDVFRGLRR